MEKVLLSEVIIMAKPNKSKAGTNIQEVKQQNAQAQAGQGQYGTEFASESTNAQEVKKQNQKSQANKK